MAMSKPIVVSPMLATDWESFRNDVIPFDAPADQLREMRIAFYAGAWAVLCRLARLSEPGVTIEAGIAGLELLRRECEAFQRAVVVEDQGQGHATGR